MKVRRLWSFFSLLLITGLLAASLGGCGATPAPTTAPEPTQAAEAEPTQAAEAEPTQVAEAEPTQVAEAEPTQAPEPTEAPEPTAPPEPEETSMTIVIAEDPPGFNGSISETGYEILVMELALLAMTDIDDMGNVFPELAAELPTIDNGGVVVDEDAWTMDVTWKMRDDVQWADGEPLTADDVVFTWNAIADPDTGIWVPGVDYTDSIEKIDDYTVVVHYNTVYPGYLTQLGGYTVAIWPEHYCDASQGFVSWDCNRNPLSSGPYMVEEWETGDHLTLVRNPNYFEEGKPAIDTILVQIVPEGSVRKTMMMGGDGDLDMWLSEPIIDELEAASGVGVSISPTTRWVMRLHPNQAARGTIDPVESPHPVFSDARVRHAVRMAIDVETISQEFFNGHPVPVWTEFFRPPYECDIPQPTYDPEGAKALLEEAGWSDQDGDGVRECHGCATGAEEGYPMEIEMMTYAEYGEALELTHQLMGEMLQEIGFDVKLSVVEGSLLWSDYESGGIEQNGDFDLNLWDDGYSGVDPTDFIWQYYYSEAAEPDYGWNVERYMNEDFDALLDEAYTYDEEYRKELFCQMAEMLEEDLPIILLFSTIEANAFSERLDGVRSSVNDIVTWNAADWTVR